MRIPSDWRMNRRGTLDTARPFALATITGGQIGQIWPRSASQPLTNHEAPIRRTPAAKHLPKHRRTFRPRAVPSRPARLKPDIEPDINNQTRPDEMGTAA